VTRGRAAVTGALAGAAVTVALAGCGGSPEVEWKGRPDLYIPANLPGDRILTGTVRNTGAKALVVKVSDLRLRDARGRRVPASAQFIRTFAHGIIFPDTKARDDQPLVEQRRIGNQVLLKPGATAPLLVSWHAPRGEAPQRVELGTGDGVPSLPVPADGTARPTRG